VDQGDDLGVRGHRGGAHDVGVALVELPVTSLLGALRPPHRGDLVALEGPGEVRIHGHHPGQGDREVVAQAELLLALPVAGVVDQLLRVRPVFAHQRLAQLQGRGLERLEAVGFEDLLEGPDHIPAQHHLLGKDVPHPAGQTGFHTSTSSSGFPDRLLHLS
jgi:hypothetical protein